MSDQRASLRFRMLLGAAAFFGFVHPATGQDAAQLRTRLLSARRAERAASDTLRVLRERTRLDLPPDSVVAGAIIVRYDAHEVTGRTLALLRGGTQLAWRDMTAFLGDGALIVAGAVPIIARKNTALPVFATRGLEFSLPHAPGRNVSTGLPIRERAVANSIEELLGSRAPDRAPDAVRRWTSEWIPVRPLDQAAWERAAVDLATSNSAATRACYAGGLAQCASSLGLTSVRDPLTEWYSPDDWRVLVSTWTPDTLDVTARRARAACLERSEFATCERLSRQRNVPIPLSIWTRHTLYDLALTRGGAGAFTRMLNTQGSALEILSATASMTPDSLLAQWRAKVVAAAPRDTRPGALEATLALAWTLAFGVAATRSRPCR